MNNKIWMVVGKNSQDDPEGQFSNVDIWGLFSTYEKAKYAFDKASLDEYEWEITYWLVDFREV